MNIIYAEYNINHNSIDIATTAGYLLRIDCWEAEKGLKTTPYQEFALNTLAIDEPLEYAKHSIASTYSFAFEHFLNLDNVLGNISCRTPLTET